MNNTYQNIQNNLKFGSSIIHRCKTKELNMFIEKASRMARELSNNKCISTQNSIERVNSLSIGQRNSDCGDPSQFIPSTMISLQNNQKYFNKTFNSNFAKNNRTRTSNRKTGLKMIKFNSITQKNSFSNQTSTQNTPLKDNTDYKRGNRCYRGSLKTSVTRQNSLNKNIAESCGQKRNLSMSQDSPFEIESINYSKNQNLKYTKNIHLDLSPK